jgi:homoserine dehydrogenase
LDIEDILITYDLGYAIELIGSAQKTKDGIDLNHEHAFAIVENGYNHIMIAGKDSIDVLFYRKAKSCPIL